MEPVKVTTLSLNVIAVAFISFCTSAPTDTIIGKNGLISTNDSEQQQKQPINAGKFAVGISGKVTPRIFGPAASDSDDPDFSDSGQANQLQTKTGHRGGGRQQAGSRKQFLAKLKQTAAKWRPPAEKPTTPRTKAPSNRQPLLPLVLQKTLESIGEYKNSKNVKVSAIIIIEDASIDGSVSTSKPTESFGTRNNQDRPSFNEEPEDEMQPQEQTFGGTDMTNNGEY